MRNKLPVIATLIIACLITVRCAKSEGENWQDAEQISLDAWMEKYNPQATRLESGMWMEWLREPVAGAAKPDAGDWLQLNYRGTTLGGDVYMTRYEEETKMQGTHSLYAHYVPHYMQYSESMALTAGEIEALGLMAENDSVRLYLPSHMAYGDSGGSFSNFYGYNGETTTIAGRKPVIIDLVLNEVVVDEDAYERNKVVGMAQEWGLGVNDTIRRNLYLQVIEEDPAAAVIAKDSTVYLYFVGRFLDGFLLDTNVDSIAQKERLDYSAYTPDSYKTSSSTGVITAWNESFMSEKMRYNSRYRMVFTSQWGYGSTEQAATTTSPVIYPYTPLIFEITTLPEDYDPNASDEDE